MTLEKQIAEDYGIVLKEAQSMGCNKINALYNIPLDNMKAIVNALEEVQKYRAIGTPEECRAAVEKQKEMIAYCDENNCADCPYRRGNMKENRCMNDFIAEKISKGVCNACIDAIGGGDN